MGLNPFERCSVKTHHGKELLCQRLAEAVESFWCSQCQLVSHRTCSPVPLIAFFYFSPLQIFISLLRWQKRHNYTGCNYWWQWKSSAGAQLRVEKSFSSYPLTCRSCRVYSHLIEHSTRMSWSVAVSGSISMDTNYWNIYSWWRTRLREGSRLKKKWEVVPSAFGNFALIVLYILLSQKRRGERGSVFLKQIWI